MRDIHQVNREKEKLSTIHLANYSIDERKKKKILKKDFKRRKIKKKQVTRPVEKKEEPKKQYKIEMTFEMEQLER